MHPAGAESLAILCHPPDCGLVLEPEVPSVVAFYILILYLKTTKISACHLFFLSIVLTWNPSFLLPLGLVLNLE